MLEADTDVIGHINGGHTALPDDQIRCICEGCKRGLELVHNGNERSALYTLRIAREMGDLNRVILGTDAPAGSGVQPLGILRMVSMLSSLGDVPAEIAFCFATGNTARMRELDCGLIEVGRSADFVIMDKAQHSAGQDHPRQRAARRPARHRHDHHRRHRPHHSAAATRRRRPRCRRSSGIERSETPARGGSRLIEALFGRVWFGARDVLLRAAPGTWLTLSIQRMSALRQKPSYSLGERVNRRGVSTPIRELGY